MNLKDTWKKFVAALSPEPVNTMSIEAMAHIRTEVRKNTAFDITSMDTRRVNTRMNVGLVMAPTTPEAEIKDAQAVFIAAAKEKGVTIDASKILLYVPGTVTYGTRVSLGGGKTWISKPS